MGLFTWFSSIFNTESVNWSAPAQNDPPSINPANGMPMANESIDVMGNPFGTDLNHMNDFTDPIDISSSDPCGGFSDDSFGCGGFDDNNW